MTDADFARMEEAVRALNERIANCHLEVACPTCGEPRGFLCIRKGTSKIDAVWSLRLKHPHRERWTQVVPAR